LSTAASWVTKVGGKKFSDGHLQISDREDYGWMLKSSILPQNSPKIENFQPQILYIWVRIFGQKENFSAA